MVHASTPPGRPAIARQRIAFSPSSASGLESSSRYPASSRRLKTPSRCPSSSRGGTGRRSPGFPCSAVRSSRRSSRILGVFRYARERRDLEISAATVGRQKYLVAITMLPWGTRSLVALVSASDQSVVDPALVRRPHRRGLRLVAVRHSPLADGHRDDGRTAPATRERCRPSRPDRDDRRRDPGSRSRDRQTLPRRTVLEPAGVRHGLRSRRPRRRGVDCALCACGRQRRVVAPRAAVAFSAGVSLRTGRDADRLDIASHHGG